MNGWIAFSAHVLATAAILCIVLAMQAGKMGKRLAVVAVVLCMSATFWTICSITESSAGIGESWLAIGAVAAAYCIRPEDRHDPTIKT